MNKSILLFFTIPFILFFKDSFSQNLVPNPSFEEIWECPGLSGNILPPYETEISLKQWSLPTLGTSDYYHICGTASSSSVPTNWMGYQYPRTGDAYTGFIVFNTVYASAAEYDYKEYLQCKLTSPMVSGHKYYASYWLSSGFDPYSFNAACDKMGIYFGEDSIYIMGYLGPLLDYSPVIESPAGEIYNDTSGWKKVSGFHIAAGGEKWMVIGNFHLTSALDYEPIPGAAATPNYAAYYYVDDICLLDLDHDPTSSSREEVLLCSGSSIYAEGRSGSSFIYEWNNGATSFSQNISESGTYWVRSIDEEHCAFYVDTIMIHSIELPDVDLGEDITVCKSDSVEIGIDSNIYITSILWNTGASTAKINVDEPGQYIISVTTDCGTVSDTLQVTFSDNLEINLPADTTLCDGQVLELKVSSSTYIASYQWNTGATNCCIKVVNDGLYYVTVEDECGSVASDSVMVEFTQCHQCFVVPNAFSPNGDGLNDIFRVETACSITEYELMIFNRWGELIFHTSDISAGWDGYQDNHQYADIGVYYFIARGVISSTNKEIQVKGDLTLLR